MALSMWNSAVRERANDLHGDTWQVIFDDSITPHNTPAGWYQYISGSFSRFNCSLCRKSWASKRVQVIFNYYLNLTNNEGTIKMRRFKQKCKKCAGARMEDPNFPVENIDVLVERLIGKIRIRCYREDLGETNRISQLSGRINGPHESLHCEACQLGICTQAT